MPKAATAPAAALPAPAVTTAGVLEAVPEPVVEAEAVAVVSVVWLPPPAPVAAALPEETTDEVVSVGDDELPPAAPVAVAEATFDVLLLLGLMKVVEADAVEEETLDSEEDELLELLLLLLDVVESEDALIWNGNEYWKVEESESKLILIP